MSELDRKKKQMEQLPHVLPAQGERLQAPDVPLPGLDAAASALSRMAQGGGAGVTATPSQALAEEKAAVEPQKPVIDRETILAAQERLMKYKAGKASVEKRILQAQNWWKLNNWDEIDRARGYDPAMEQPDRPGSRWLWHCVASRHADIMDSMPEPLILPRASDDEEEARKLSRIIPVVLAYNDFESTYADTAWQQVQEGTGVYGVFWDKTKLNGLGDIAITRCNVLNLFWEPGVNDIQDSWEMFNVRLVSNRELEERYPELKDVPKGSKLTVSDYMTDDHVDKTDKSLVIDWYYKKWQGEKRVLHFCQFVGDHVLYATENEEDARESGLYDDGLFPFVFDAMYTVEGSPCGRGLIDVGKSLQETIDTLSESMTINAAMGSRPRYMHTKSSAIDRNEFMDWRGKPLVEVQGNLSSETVMPISVPGIPGNALTFMQEKIQELKQVTGNSDISSGVDSARTMQGTAMMLEAGGKIARDMNKARFRAYKKVITMVIERIRQFYDIPRQFRITGEDGGVSFSTLGNEQLKGVDQGSFQGIDMGIRVPVFDVEVAVQKENPFTRESQNQNAMTLMQMGAFSPQLTDQTLMMLDMMDFKGIENVKANVRNLGVMADRLAQWQQMALALASQYAPQMAEGLAQKMAEEGGAMPRQAAVEGFADNKGGGLAKQAADRAAQSTAPR